MRRRVVLWLALLAAIGVAGAIWWLSRPVESHEDDEAARKSGSPEAPPAAAPGLAGTKPRKSAKGEQPGQPATEAGGAAQSSDVPSIPPIVVQVASRGVPVVGATVRLRKAGNAGLIAATESDAQGFARFAAADLALVVLEAFADGFRPRRLQGERARTDADRVVEMELWPGVAIDGRVVDDATGSAIPGARVLLKEDTGDFELGPTDVHGGFHVPGIRDDSATRLVALALGHVTERTWVRVADGKPQPPEVVLRLKSGGALVGSVRAADGTPAPGALVLVRHEREQGADLTEHFVGGDYHFESRDLAFEIHATSGPDGVFRAEGLAFDEPYTATATAPGQASAASEGGIRVTPEAPEARAVLALRRPATVRLKVTIAGGASLPESARVRLFQEDLMFEPIASEPEGVFVFEGLGRGVAHAFAETEGYRSVAKEFRVEEGATRQVELSLDAGAVIEGGVFDAAGAPLSYARVVVAPLDRNWEESSSRMLLGGREARTDEAGKFTVGGLAAGDVVVAADWGEDFTEPSLATRERLVLKAPMRGMRIVLSRLGKIRMLLRKPDGAPFKGTAKTSLLQSMGSCDQGIEVEDGRVELTSLDDGDYRLAVQPNNYAWIRRRVEIRDGASVDLGVVVLDPGIRVSGRVVDGIGHPVTGAYVWCTEVESLTASTDAEGRFAFERFPREPSSLSVEAEGFSNASIALEPLRATNIEVRLPRPAKLRGTVRTGAGAPAAGREIELRRGDARPVYRTTFVTGVQGREIYYYGGSMGFECGDDGRFEIDVAPGRWIAHVVDPAGKDVSLGEWTLTDGETREVEIVLPAK